MSEGDPDAQKGGERIARDIEHRIRADRLPIGHLLGTVDSLADRYGVSRWVLREAVAIAEMDGLIRSRRGTNGGLIVAAPSEDVRIFSIRHFFILAGVTGREIIDVRRLVEGMALQRAMERMTITQAIALRTIGQGADEGRVDRASANTNAFFERLLQLADHRFLTLFAKATAQANIDRLLWYGADIDVVRGLSERTWQLRERQIAALIAHDAAAVLDVENEIHAAGIALHERYASPPGDLASAVERTSILARDYMIAEGDRSAKKPEALARLMADAIRQSDLGEGARLGFESELMDRFGVSRNVMRESVRMLERYGIVEAIRGQHGGLRVRRPDPQRLVQATAVYLADHKAKAPGDYDRIVLDLLLAAVDSALTTAEPARRKVLAERHRAQVQLARSDAPSTIVFAHHKFLAGACANPALEILIRVLNLPSDRTLVTEAALEWAVRAQDGLSRAIEAGDRALSRRYVVALHSEVGEPLF